MSIVIIIHFIIYINRCDMIKPSKENQWTLENFLSNKQYTSIFLNSLLNLNKFLAYEQRESYSKTEIDKNPEYTDWDKFAFYEYQRLTAEDSEDNQDDVNLLLIYF
jgi:hypothetical protein